MKARFCLEEQTLLVAAPPGSVVILFEPSEQEHAKRALETLKGNTIELQHIIGLLSISGSIQ